jgi:hypothetical protein
VRGAFPAAHREDSLPRDERRRHRADLERRHRARAPRSQHALGQGRKSVTFVRDCRYGLAVIEYRDRVVTERESWILGNKEAKADTTPEANAKKSLAPWGRPTAAASGSRSSGDTRPARLAPG